MSLSEYLGDANIKPITICGCQFFVVRTYGGCMLWDGSNSTDWYSKGKDKPLIQIDLGGLKENITQ